MITPHPFSAGAAANQAHLRIVETTDIHVHVLPYDYYADRPVDTVGLARTATHIEQARAEAANSILLDNGDFLQGNPMADYVAFGRGLKEGDLHPVIAALNTLGFDAATLGNHEFNYGLDFLMTSIAGAAFPVVSANVALETGADPTGDKGLVRPYVILDRRLKVGAGGEHPIRIGVIGFLPPQIMQWDRGHLDGKVRTRDILATARAWVPVMRADGADIIIALSHSGIGPAHASDGMENASVPLAAIDGIDAILTGHSHLVFPSPAFAGHQMVDATTGHIHGKPAVMAGFWGDTLGLIDLLLERDGGQWRVLSSTVETRSIFRRDGDGAVTPLVTSAPMVETAAARDHAATLAYIRRGVGRTAAPLFSHFALVADDPAVRIVNQAQRWYVSRMLTGSRYGGLPLLSAAAPFKAGGRAGPDYYTDVPAGDIAIRNVADLYLYPNTIRAVKVTGAELRDWLERSAGAFNRILPGAADQPLLNPGFASYNFDVIAGVSYEIDLAQPSKYAPNGALLNPGAQRITNLTHAGRPVDPAAEFVIATNNYRASGGGDFPGAGGDTIIFEGPDTNRDIIVRYIVENGTIDPGTDAGWRFRPMPGTTALFDTGPRATTYLANVTSARIASAGDGPDGFARFRISF